MTRRTLPIRPAILRLGKVREGVVQAPVEPMLRWLLLPWLIMPRLWFQRLTVPAQEGTGNKALYLRQQLQQLHASLNAVQLMLLQHAKVPGHPETELEPIVTPFWP